MPDDLLDLLGEYFVYYKVGSRYKITFERFVEKWRAGTWEPYLAE